MAAGDVIHVCRGAKHGSTTLANATHFAISAPTQKSSDGGGAAYPGVKDEIVTKMDVFVEIFSNSYVELLALVGLAAANFVGLTKGASGANEQITVKNVVFSEAPGQIQAKNPGSTGEVGNFSIKGRALWGASDTFATMIVSAAGS